MRYRAKHIAEYIALRGLVALLTILPYRFALAVGWLLAALIFFGLRFRVREIVCRIRSVFADRYSPRECRRIAWISWRNTVFNAVELMRMKRITPRWLHRVSNYDPYLGVLKAHTDTGCGAIIAVPHMGNWELAGIATHFHGIPIFNIAARQRNPLVNAYFNRMRSSPGIETIERGTAAMRPVIRYLKAGRVLAILPDSRMKEPGIPVPLLGGTANLGKGMALFARQANVPIFPCTLERRGWARHEAHGHPPIWPDPALDKDADVARMTRAVLEIVDAAIQRQPEQWFWFNRRWVLDPVTPA